MPDTKKVLFVGAHPDDVEMLAGGTAAMLAAKGHEVIIVTMTPGDCGTRDYVPDVIAEMRRNEAAAAANLIGARYICAEFRDMAIFNDDPSRRRVTEFLRTVRPDVVITNSPSDYHCDHEATSVLVRDACFAAGAPNYQTGSEPFLPWIPHLYFMDPVEGIDREGNDVVPDFVIDVEPHFETKRQMLACHESQREWLRKHHGMDDYVEQMGEWSAMVGKRHGVEYAEGFRRYKCHPFPQTTLLPELLGKVILVGAARRG